MFTVVFQCLHFNNAVDKTKTLNSTVFFWVMVLYSFACGCRRFGGRIVSNFRAEENDILWIFSSVLDNIPCSFCHSTGTEQRPCYSRTVVSCHWMLSTQEAKTTKLVATQTATQSVATLKCLLRTIHQQERGPWRMSHYNFPWKMHKQACVPIRCSTGIRNSGHLEQGAREEPLFSLKDRALHVTSTLFLSAS